MSMRYWPRNVGAVPVAVEGMCPGTRPIGGSICGGSSGCCIQNAGGISALPQEEGGGRVQGLPAGDCLRRCARNICLVRGVSRIMRTTPGAPGVEAMNNTSERLLAKGGLIDHRRRRYRGRPVMIARNDHQQQLFNGEVGLSCPTRNQTAW